MRLFVAVELPARVRRALGELVRQLATCGADVKWVEEENFHLTLKFLGEVEPAVLPQLREALARVAREVTPFAFSAAGTGAFPSVRRPRVIWVGVDRGREELRELARRVDMALSTLGFPREDRPFAAHLTVGRVRSPRGGEALARLLDSTDFPEQMVPVEEVVLFQSVLGRSGPVYTPLERYPLGGGVGGVGCGGGGVGGGVGGAGGGVGGAGGMGGGRGGGVGLSAPPTG